MDHPEEPDQRQVRTRQFDRWVIRILPFVALSVALIALVGLAVLEDWRSRSSAPAGTGAGPTAAPTPQSSPPASAGRYQAAVVSLPDTSVASPRPGWIRQLRVRQGQRVSVGQVVAILQPADESGARAETAYRADAEAVSAARSELKDARSAVAAADAAASSVRSRLSNAKTALAGARSALVSARARGITASRALQRADAAVENARDLFEQGVAPERELREAQQAQVEAAAASNEATRATEEAQADIAAAQDRVDAEAEALNQAQARLSSARSAAASVERGVARLEAAANRSLAEARTLQRGRQPFEVRSPTAGIVAVIALAEGALATPGTAVITVRPEKTSVAVFDVTDGEVDSLRTGMPVVVREPRSGAKLQGRVAVVQPLPAGGQKRNRVVVEIGDPSGALRAGTSVAVETKSTGR